MKKKFKLTIYIIIALSIIVTIIGKPPKKEAVPTSTKTFSPNDYDDLEQLYVDIDESMTYSEVLELVEETKLPYTVEKFWGSRAIKVAFSDSVASQSEEILDGDYVEIDFDENRKMREDKDEKFTFASVEYYNYEKKVNIVHLVSGSWWDLYTTGNDVITGYFIDDHKKREDGYEFKYGSGTRKVNYLKVDSKEEQLEFIFNLKNK